MSLTSNSVTFGEAQLEKGLNLMYIDAKFKVSKCSEKGYATIPVKNALYYFRFWDKLLKIIKKSSERLDLITFLCNWEY